jgi:OOP family OmpA-OmpF porin
MKAKLHKLSIGLAASAAIMAASAYGAEDLYVNCGFGGPVKDPFGKCVLSVGGSRVPGCFEVAQAVPAPEPMHKEITLGADALFNFDKYYLKPAGKASLDQLVSDLREVQSVESIKVTGHTDSKGTEAYNQALSERRAGTVKDYLVEKGVNASVITARGEGELNPVAPNTLPNGKDNPEGRAKNRRVEIVVDATKQVLK